MISSLVLSAVLMAPPGGAFDHTQPYHSGSIVHREFVRRDEDRTRRERWEVYSRDLSVAWSEYRRAGSTPRAFQEYLLKLNRLKREYVWSDEYLEPIMRFPVPGASPITP